MDWAALLRPPIKEYLLLLDHPPNTSPITGIEDIARIKRIPIPRSQDKKGPEFDVALESIGIKLIVHGAKNIIGARLKRNLSAPSGVISSLKRSFTASAIV